MSGDDSTFGTLPVGWSVGVGVLLLVVFAVCVWRIVKDVRS